MDSWEKGLGRETKRRQRELERRAKEQAKLSALEQARLEVETFENGLELLLSLHKEKIPVVNWRALASGLLPHQPPRVAPYELVALAKGAGLEEARAMDDHEYAATLEVYEKEAAQWEETRALARRVLAGEPSAYTEALSGSSALKEISNLGSSIHMTVDSANLIECELTVNDRDVIPADVKSLTASGKLSIKPMPKARFLEVYHDYVCSCILRLAQEMFALLPVDTVLLTAAVNGIDSRTGHPADLPILSVVATREIITRLDFERLDPSDALGNFQYRGDVMTSRKSSEFIPITPLTLSDITTVPSEQADFTFLVRHVKDLHAELAAMFKPALSEMITTKDPSESN